MPQNSQFSADFRKYNRAHLLGIVQYYPLEPEALSMFLPFHGGPEAIQAISLGGRPIAAAQDQCDPGVKRCNLGYRADTGRIIGIAAHEYPDILLRPAFEAIAEHWTNDRRLIPGRNEYSEMTVIGGSWQGQGRHRFMAGINEQALPEMPARPDDVYDKIVNRPKHETECSEQHQFMLNPFQ